MKFLIVFLVLIGLLTPSALQALTYEEGADAPTRTIEDYIKDFVDIPKGGTDWKVFGKTKEVEASEMGADGIESVFYTPVFPPEVKALDGKEITIRGFMFPLDSTEKQKLFLIGPFPLNCPYQYHVGSALVIEVHADNDPIAFSYDPVTIKGTMELVSKDPEFSVFYRLKNATQVK